MGIPVWVWDDEQGRHLELRDGERPESVPAEAWPAEQCAEIWRAEIMGQLSAIDLASIRHLREGNVARVTELEAQAESLRAILRAIAP